jgi:hypothetical protein
VIIADDLQIVIRSVIRRIHSIKRNFKRFSGGVVLRKYVEEADRSTMSTKESGVRGFQDLKIPHPPLRGALSRREKA